MTQSGHWGRTVLAFKTLHNLWPYGGKMKRRELFTLIGGAAVAWPISALAQRSERVRHIGVLSPFSENDPETKSKLTAFKERFEHLGWTDGRNVQIEYRFADGNPERTRAAAAELAALAPDVILAYANPAVGTQAHHQHYPHRFHPSVRSGWKWIRHGPRTSWRQYYWVSQL
jgi:hypothetical protein